MSYKFSTTIFDKIFTTIADAGSVLVPLCFLRFLVIALIVACSIFPSALLAQLPSDKVSFIHSPFISISENARPNVQVYEESEYLLGTGRSNSAIAYARQELVLALKRNDLPTAIYAEWTIGRTFGRKGKSVEMFDHFFRALRLADEFHKVSNNKYWQAFVELSIGSMYIQGVGYDRAASFLQRALSASMAIGDSVIAATALSGFAEIEGQQQRYDKMIHLLFIAVNMLPTTTNTSSHTFFVRGLLYGQLGIAYKDKLQYDSSRIALLYAADIFSQTENKRFVPDVYLTLAKLYTAQRKTEAANAALDSVALYIERLQLNITHYALFKARAVLADTMGDYETAYRYFCLFHDARDSVFSTSSAVKTEDLKNEFAQRLETEQQKFRWYIMVALVAALCIVLVVLWSRFQIKKHGETALFQQQERLADQAFVIQNANTELSQKNVELRNLNTLKNTFLGIATHDLKNPLTQIMLSAGLIEHQLSVLLKAQPDLQSTTLMLNTERVLSSAEFMNRIIEDLLDVNKLESGRIVSTLGTVSLSVLAKVIQANQHYADTKGIRIEIIQSEEGMMNCCVRADELALMQVFDNILSNAIKYSPLNKSIKIQVNKELQPNVFTSGENISWVRIAIQDEGPGLTDDDKGKIFEKFARLSAKPTAGESSTGLGLAISKELMQQMNGEIGCESEIGEGATFFIRLPYIPQVEDRVEGAAA